MRIKRIVVIMFALVILISFSGCKKNKDNYEGQTKVTYNLEGGEFQNCTAPIIQYYKLEKNKQQLIYDPCELGKQQMPTHGDYVFDGWYKTKIVNGDKTTYSNKWDFKRDHITTEGLTLYAKWKTRVNYTYNVCYLDDNNQKVILGSYNVSEGEKFLDSSNYSMRLGYTTIKCTDENGNLWDENFGHPGGDEDLAVDVYFQYIKGRYALVKTAQDLKSNKSQNIYLLNDIDMGGVEFSFNGYNKIFEGNGHTISNFKINYDPNRTGLVADFEDENRSSLCISIFGNTENASISNVNFENVTTVINTTYSLTYRVYFAGISINVTNSNIKNVKFNGKVEIKALPSNFDIDDDLIIVDDNIYYLKDDKSTIENMSVSVEITDIRSN